MAASSDLISVQQFSTTQGSQGPDPTTLASATTIAPTQLITYVSGTAAVATITPPMEGMHMLVLIYTNAAPVTTVTTGNIVNAILPVINVPVIALFDPARAKYLLK